MGIIYKIQNILNEKLYIGQTVNNLDIRIKGHINCKQKIGLHGAIKKYGIENFEWEIIEKCDDSELNEREKYYIKKLKSHYTKDGYNLTWGGDGVSGWKHDDKIKKKISIKSKQLWIDDEYRKKIHTKEANKKTAKSVSIISRKNFKNPEYRKKHLKGIKKANKNSELRQKRRQSAINRYSNEEERSKQSERLSRAWLLIDPNGRKIKVKNLKMFCQDNFKNSKSFLCGLHRVSKGKQKEYKNWKCIKCS